MRLLNLMSNFSQLFRDIFSMMVFARDSVLHLRHLGPSRRLRFIIRKGYVFGRWLGCHPYGWDDGTNMPIFCDSRFRSVVWHLNMVATVAYYIFVLVRCIQCLFFTKGVSIENKFYMMFMACYFTFPTAFQLMIYTSQKSNSYATTQYLKLMQSAEDLFARDVFNASTGIVNAGFLFYAFIYCGFNVNTIFMAFLSFLRPSSPEYLSSLWWYPGAPSLYLLPTFLFQLYYEIMYHSLAFVIAFSQITCIVMLIATLKQLRYWLRQQHGWRKQPDVVFRVYRQLQIASAICMEITTGLVSSIGIILVMVAAFSTFVAIRLSGFIATALGVIGVITTLFLIVLFTFLSEVDNKCRKLKAEMRTLVLYKKEFRVYFKSLPVISYRLGVYAVVDKTFSLLLVKLVFDLTINILLFYAVK